MFRTDQTPHGSRRCLGVNTQDTVVMSQRPALGPHPRQLSMMRGSSTEKRTPELRRRKSPSAGGDASVGSEEALSIVGLFDLPFGLPFPRCRPFLKTPDSFFKPACRQLHHRFVLDTHC